MASDWMVRKRILAAHFCIWTIALLALTITLTVHPGDIIGIVYMIFFITFLLLFQLSYKIWARFVKLFCILLILFSAVVITALYSYQYSTVETFWKSILPDNLITDIGLTKLSGYGTLLFQLIIPLVFVTCICIYLKYFHYDLTRLAYLANEYEDPNLDAPLTSANSSHSIHQKVSRIDKVCDCFWRILETHYIKVTFFFVFRLATTDLSLINVPFVFLVILALRYPSLERCTARLSSLLSGLIITARMTYRLTIFTDLDVTVICPVKPGGPPTGVANSLLDYIGFRGADTYMLTNIYQYLIVLVLTTIYSFIDIHRKRRQPTTLDQIELSFGIIFKNIGRREADKSIINTLMYFLNVGFYKFGLELSCLALVLAISNRLDVVAFLYGLCLVIFTSSSRHFCAKVWPLFQCLMSVIIPVQYILALGYPKLLCKAYPWYTLNADFRQWLYLSDYSNNPQVYLLYFDFLIFLAACRQMIVFKNTRPTSSNQSSTRGYQPERHDELGQFFSTYLPGPDEYRAEDCFTNFNTPNNFLKSAFFMSIYWITLAAVLVAGATKVSLFSLGYLLGCFIFLWLGNDAYLMPTRKLINRWNWFIFYVTFVLTAKTVLQLFVCYYYDSLLASCYMLQLLRVVCYKKYQPAAQTQCSSLPNEGSDLLWDGVCLLFLLIQRIVFGSQYFMQLVQEVKAQKILASRGAELILATQMEEAKAQAAVEKEVMKSIKAKMENLKFDQTNSEAWRTLMTLPHHHQIIRNADKHLFESLNYTPVSYNDNYFNSRQEQFIPDPIGDELERMAKLNGINAVFSRYMRGQELYKQTSGPSSCQNSFTSSPNAPASVKSDAGEADEIADWKDNDVSQDLTRQVKSDTTDKEPATEDHANQTDETTTGFCSTLNLLAYSCLLSATVALNKASRSYRYVSRRMAVEKTTLKTQFDLSDPRFKSDPLWRQVVISKISETYNRTTAVKQMAFAAASSQHPPQVTFASRASSPDKHSPFESIDSEYHFLKTNIFTQFLRAIGYLFISNTSLLCHIIVILNQLVTTSLLSLPMPLLTFLWGTLSVPRPTQRFWKTVITYTEIVIIIKYVFQFPLWNWSYTNTNPLYFPTLFGVKDVTISYDLFLLIALFFHRSMLKSLGQWDATTTSASTLAIDNMSVLSPTSEVRSASEPLGGDSWNGMSVEESKPISPMTQSSPNVHTYMEQPSPSIRLAEDAQIEIQQLAMNNEDVDHLHSYQHEDFIITEIDLEKNDVGRKFRKYSMCCSSCCTCCTRAYRRSARSIGAFFRHVLNTPYRVQTDVYTWMFLCDFINFLILIYGFWAFGGAYTNQSVTSFLDENRIPFSVLIMLLAQFASIIFDRAFYLKRKIGAKLVFQVILIFIVHFWLFFALPFVVGHSATMKQAWPPKAWYIFKCIYFLLSAHQIRCGYPKRVLGNCFTKGYGYTNWGAFKVYRAIPLVYDLRLYMDWIWTKTTLEFRNWAIMEDMFANLFIRKCELTLEEEYPRPKARPQPDLSKYLTGGSFILLILAIIWGPLLLFSMGKSVGESNPPIEMEFELEFVGYQPIIRMRATTESIKPLASEQYNQLKVAKDSLAAQGFLSDYKVGDVTYIQLDGQSIADWGISLPSKKRLIENIKSNDTLVLKSTWNFYRIKKQKSQNIDISIAGSYSLALNNSQDDTISEFRTKLAAMLTNSSTSIDPETDTINVTTPPIFPKFIRVPESGQATVVTQLDDISNNQNISGAMRPLVLSYIRLFDQNTNSPDSSTSWWQASDPCKFQNDSDAFSFWSESAVPHCSGLLIVAFNDRIFTGILAVLSAPGIIGLYTTFVVFFARLIRTEPSGRVIYSEIPNVDRIYGLIMDIYVMRECGQFELEEKLFSKLLFLYRSPELLIEWSRRNDEGEQVALD